MADKSAIEWTHATWNPTTGCDRVSVGCDNCYALELSGRLKRMGQPRYQADGDPRTSGPGFGITLHPDILEMPTKWSKPRMIFVNSMSDLFHAQVPLDFVKRVFDVIERTPQHTYQLLTKRSLRLARAAAALNWPQNLWVGVSVESADQLIRVNHLRSVPSAVHFISAEPLLGSLSELDLAGIDWLIVGGESGRRARQPQSAWVEELRDLALAANVAFFFKQWGGRTAKAGGRLLDGQLWDEFPRSCLSLIGM